MDVYSLYTAAKKSERKSGKQLCGRQLTPTGIEYKDYQQYLSPLQPTRGSGERRELPQRGPRPSPGRKQILAYFEGHRTLFCT